MPRNEHCLRIPNGQHDKNMQVEVDAIYLTITQTCCWHYTDPSDCFGGQLPLRGTLGAGNYGPFVATRPGLVQYGATPGPCPTPHAIIPTTPHTITVSSTGGPLEDGGENDDDETHG